MIKASRVGHATFETPDLDRAIAYYTDVNGLVLNAKDKNRAFLASKTGLLTIALEQGGEENLKRLSFEVSPNANFADMAKRLSADGVKSEVHSDTVPGIGKVLAFDDPKGTTIELFTRMEYLGSHHQVLGAGPLKLGHIAYVVEDPKAMADFYCRVLGFRVSDWIEDYFVFLRCNPDHHTVNFVARRRQDASHRLRDEGLRPHPGRLRAARAAQDADQLGPGAAWPGAQRRHLSSQFRRPECRVLHRARPDEGRGAGLFRSPPLASRHASSGQRPGTARSRPISGGRCRCRTSCADHRRKMSE